MIQNWNCDKCQHTSCTKSTFAWTFPNHVIIHLKRFDNNGNKISTLIDFPFDELNLTRYLSKEKNDPNNYIYTLYAINYHMGSAKAGHYWSVCKNLDDNWYLLNDGHVSQYQKVTEVQKKDAYILFYHRKMIVPS
jgi:ubiquitin C-terminal hydrolase